MAFAPLNFVTKSRILQEGGPAFLQRIGIHVDDPIFRAHLVKKDVLSEEDAADMKLNRSNGFLSGAITRPSERKDMLLNHLRQCSVTQFIDFCLVLHDEAKRADILCDIFKLDVNHLREQRGLSVPNEATIYPFAHDVSYSTQSAPSKPSAAPTHSPGVIPQPPLPQSSHTEGLGPMSEHRSRQSTLHRRRPLHRRRHGPSFAPSPAPSQISSHSSTSGTLEPEVVRIIADHAKGCLRLLMHHNLYDIGDSPSAKVVHTGKVYIKVDTEQEAIDGNLVEVPEEDILRCSPGESSLRVVQVHGPPGAGKTSLAEHVVCDWAKKFLEHVERFGLTGVDKDLFTTMVFIPTRTIKNTLDEALWDHLLCKEQDKKVLFNHVKKGEGIGLALDAIDEIRSKAVLHNVREYLKFQHTSGDGTCVLVTTRSDLGNIESANFDRILVLQGFTWEQGIEYIKAYFPGDKSEKVVRYTQAHRQHLFPIITNPLRAHIYCALISEGELKLDENDDLSILKLFHLLEKCLIKRKGSKVTEEQSRCMYEMCMHGLLHGMRLFSQDCFDRFNIDESCQIFFLRKEKISPLGSEVSYSFPHEMMYEYFAGRYIESLSLDSRKTLLLSISTDPAFRNLQKIIFEILLQQDQLQLLQMMTRAILVLQHECNEENKPKGLLQRFTLYGNLVKLHTQIQPLDTIDLSVLSLGSLKNTKKINKILKTINDVFDDKSAPLKKTKWYLGLGNGVFAHINDCFQACSPNQMAMLTKNTTDHLLPCHFEKKKRFHFVCSTSGGRYGEVVYEPSTYNTYSDIRVHAWCVDDVQQLLYQYRTSAAASTHHVERVLWFDLYIDQYQSLWGQPPPSTASIPDVWTGVYTELQQWSHMCTKNYKYTINPCDTTPLYPLLVSGMRTRVFGVYRGTIDIQDLYTLVHTGQLTHVYRLDNTHIVVPPDGDQEALREMRDEVVQAKGTVDGKLLSVPHFITHTGEVYTWGDGYNWK